MRVAGITLRQYALPLREPYHLAFGPVHRFETLIVEGQDRDGRVGLGEATLLAGYTDETPVQSWRSACVHAETAIGLDAAEAIERFAPGPELGSFTASALTSAIEMLAGHDVLGASGAVPLLAVINAKQPDAIEREVEATIAAGYTTLKVKVGWDVVHDARRVGLIQRLCAGRARLRIDANQGYSREQALAFLAELDPEDIELVEQTCAAGDWESARAVRAHAPVPVMLDESIYGLEDIDRAARLEAADLIKLKLVKCGGLSRLIAGLERIRERGMTPVLGNGVATDLGCWMEACVAHHAIDNAGEMNGFLKAADGLLEPPLDYAAPDVLLDGSAGRRLGPAAERHLLRSTRFPET